MIRQPVQEVFEFFSNAENLETLTPKNLKFEILTPAPIEMRPGALIDYRIKLFGIPMYWKTEITEFEPGVRFVDTQLKGPYKQWIHEHRFEAVDGGTLMTDTVDYEIGFGFLGAIAQRLFVKQEVEKIFRYRQFALAHAL